MAAWQAVSSSSFPRTPLPTPATNSQLTSLVSYSSPHPLAGSPCSPSSLLMLPPTAQAASAPARSPEPRAVCKQPTLHPGPTAQITPSCYLCVDLLSPRHKACLFLFERPPPVAFKKNQHIKDTQAPNETKFPRTTLCDQGEDNSWVEGRSRKVQLVLLCTS